MADEDAFSNTGTQKVLAEPDELPLEELELEELLPEELELLEEPPLDEPDELDELDELPPDEPLPDELPPEELDEPPLEDPAPAEWFPPPAQPATSAAATKQTPTTVVARACAPQIDPACTSGGEVVCCATDTFMTLLLECDADVRRDRAEGAADTEGLPNAYQPVKEPSVADVLVNDPCRDCFSCNHLIRYDVLPWHSSPVNGSLAAQFGPLNPLNRGV